MISPFRKSRAPVRRWHHVRLEAPQIHDGEHERMRLRFNWLWMAGCWPQDMSLWMATRSDGGADIYISPQSIPMADDLIRRYEARPCDPPVPSPVLLLAGCCYASQVHRVRPRMRNPRTRRRFLPARYHYRSVRSLTQNADVGVEPAPLDRSRMAPFVRRFVQAWSLFAAAPAHAEHEDR